MKRSFHKTLSGLALALVLALGFAAFAAYAETPSVTEPEMPMTEEGIEDAIEETIEEAADDAAGAVPEEPAEAPDAGDEAAPNDDAAWQEAIDAYRSAKQAQRVESLEEELNSMVESGALTQEQADLILNRVKAAPQNGKGLRSGRGFGKQDGKSRMNGMNGFGGQRGNGGRGFGRTPRQENGVPFQAPQQNAPAPQQDQPMNSRPAA